MPSDALKKLVKDAPGKSLDDAERYWDEAEQAAKDQGLTEGSDDFYAYVMAIVMRRLGLKEASSLVALASSPIRLSPKDRANLRKLTKTVVRVMPYSNPIRALMFVQALLDNLVVESLEWAADYVDDSELEMRRLKDIEELASSTMRAVQKDVEQLAGRIASDIDWLNKERLLALKRAIM